MWSLLLLLLQRRILHRSLYSPAHKFKWCNHRVVSMYRFNIASLHMLQAISCSNRRTVKTLTVTATILRTQGFVRLESYIGHALDWLLMSSNLQKNVTSLPCSIIIDTLMNPLTKLKFTNLRSMFRLRPYIHMIKGSY